MTIAPVAGFIPSWTLADRLRKAREVTGMDQQSFAAHVGISRQSVSSAELGRTEPRELTIRAWAMATGVDVDWLRTGETNNAPEPEGTGASDGLSPHSARPKGLEPLTFCSVVDLGAWQGVDAAA